MLRFILLVGLAGWLGCLPALVSAQDLTLEGGPHPPYILGGEWGKMAGMKLPNGEQAELGVKLEDYVLNPLHREGQHKAHVFASVLGITSANARVLRNALLDAAAFSDHFESKGDNGFGTVYVLRFPLATAKIFPD
jgi:hypothetical protein